MIDSKKTQATLWSMLLLVLVNFMQGSSSVSIEKDDLLFRPDSYKAEGKIGLVFNSSGNEAIVNLHIAFQEIEDATSQRSKVKIDYTASAQEIVYQKRDAKIIKINASSRCELSKDNEHDLVPEINWLAKLIYKDLLHKNQLKSPLSIGPTALIRMVLQDANINSATEQTETHRNIPCRVISFKLDSEIIKNGVLRIYIPPEEFLSADCFPFFAATFVFDAGEGKASFTVDYFSVKAIYQENAQELEDEFSLPLGIGCSEQLPKLQDPDIKDQSIVMFFAQSSTGHLNRFVYDSTKDYLSRNVLDTGQRLIWDFKEDLLYLSSNNGIKRRNGQPDSSSIDEPEMSLEDCSVLRIKDHALGAGQRPQRAQETTKGEKFDVLRFLGATDLSYLGRSSIRGLPCLVYETILKEPPAVFGLSSHSEDSTDHDDAKYILQFHLLGFETPSNSNNSIGKEFFPAMINLFKQNDSLSIEYDSLEIYDFHFGLPASDSEPSKLFMMAECFEIEEEQVEVQLLLGFEVINQNSNNSGTYAFDHLRKNKYSLELEILKNLFGTIFQISRIHLTEFELLYRDNDVLVNMIISDRKDDKSLSYFGTGTLPNGIDQKNIISIDGQISEETCVSSGAQLNQVTLILSCPSKCIAVINESPALENSDSESKTESYPGAPKDQQSVCHAYKLSKADPPESSIENWTKWRDSLNNHKFSFEIDDRSQGSTIRFTAIVQSSLVKRQVPIEMVEEYRYLLKSDSFEEQKTEEIVDGAYNQEHPADVRSFTMIDYRTIGDCERMCNLDISCLSYSYCTSDNVPSNEKCLLSSLDIRVSEVNQQLLYQASQTNNVTQVKDTRTNGAVSYNIKMEDGCNIYEKDYLDSFTETGETMTLAVDMKTNTHLHKSEGTADCAKFALNLEGQHDQQLSQLIAYCPDSQACLVDSNMLESELRQSKNDPKTSETSHCVIYRRKYQTFFHVYPQVLRRANIIDSERNEQDHINKFSQLPLELSTAEECAHLCWNQLGHICASFDYCSNESLCLINSIALDESPDVMSEHSKVTNSMTQSAKDNFNRLIEQRKSCLHHERDLKFDRLRESYATKHKSLEISLAHGDSKNQTYPSTFGEILLYIVLSCLVLMFFVAGSFVGKRINKKLEQEPIILSGSNGIVNFINSLTSAVSNRENDTVVLSEETQGTQMHTIELENVGTNRTGQDLGDDELTRDNDSKGDAQ